MSQTEKITKLPDSVSNQGEFASARAMEQYIGVCTRPDVCASVQLVAPGASVSPKEDLRLLEKVIAHLKETVGIGLKFVKLDMESVRILVYTDASFANAPGFRSQLVYVILLVDSDDTCNIIHYGSLRCRRVTRSVLASEVHALVVGFDQAFALQDMLAEMIGRKLDIEVLVDSNSVFDLLAKDGRTLEKRLQIDVHATKESYENGELARVGWVPGDRNPADALTKRTIGAPSPLWEIMTTNRLSVKECGWSTKAQQSSEN